MTLKSLSSLALASIFALATVAAEARPGDDNRGGPGRGSDRGGDRGGFDRGYGRDRDNDRGPGRPGHGGPGGGPGWPGHGGPGRPGPRPPMPPPHHPPRPAPRPPMPPPPMPPRPPAPPPPHYPPSYPPNHGQVSVGLPINQRMYNSTSIDLTRFVDLRHYAGYRVIAVEINARSVYGNAILDLFVNGYSNQSIYVGPYAQLFTMYPSHVILGYNSSNLVLSNRGDVDVYGITLRLSR